MENYEIRAVTKLVLDPVREKDVIDEIESLIAHRKLGNYITNLLRFAAEHRQDLEELGFNSSNRGVVDTRKRLLHEYLDELNAVKTKVDALFEMVLALKTAFEIGHVTALETQVDNAIAAKIVVQNQVNKLKRLLGEELPFVFKDSGVIYDEEINKAAKEAAELALAHYGNEISALAASFNELKNEYLRPTMVDNDYFIRNTQIAGSVGNHVGSGNETTNKTVAASGAETDSSKANMSEEKEKDVASTQLKDTDNLQFDADDDDIAALAALLG